MKKSNKILLGGLLTIILILVAVHVALFARYKAGNYVPYSETQSEKARIVKEFPTARSIHFLNLPNVVLRIGDRMKVEQYGDNASEIIMAEQGGRVELSLKDNMNANKGFNYLIVYVPENSTITSQKTMLRMEGINGKQISNLNFSISGGLLGFDPSNVKVQIDSLTIHAANQASVELQNIQVNKLSVQLQASDFNDQGATIQQIQLNADTTSRVSLQTKNLLKLTTKTTAHE